MKKFNYFCKIKKIKKVFFGRFDVEIFLDGVLT